MSGASNFLARDMLDERRRKRNEFIQRNAVAGVQGAAGGIADYGAMMEQAKVRRAEQRARREEITGNRDARRQDAATEHERALELIRARGGGRPSAPARSSSRARSSSTFADKAALKQSGDERQRAIDDAGKRVAMALAVGGLPTARKRADETAKSIAAKYGMDVEDVRRQVSLASTAADDAQTKRFQAVADKDRSDAMADTKLDRETAALGMDESKLDGQLNHDGPQFQQANAAEMNAQTSQRRQDLAEKKYKNRPRGSGNGRAAKDKEVEPLLEYDDDIAFISKIEGQLDLMGDANAEDSLGPWDTVRNEAAQWLRIDDEDTTALQGNLTELLTKKIKRISGAAVTAAEEKRIRKATPNTTDDLATVRRKLSDLKSILQEARARRVQMLGARGVNTSELGPSGAPAAPPPAASNRVNVTLPNGDTKSIPRDQLKRFNEWKARQ